MNMKMNILIMTDSYPPEIRSASHLMQELAEDLSARGHKVAVITATPRYNLVQDTKPIKFQPNCYENGVQVIRVNTLPIHKVGLIVRGIGQLTLPYIFYKAAMRWIKEDIDIIIVYSPPLPLGMAGIWLKKYFKAKLILNIQDIFPQNAIDLKEMKNTFIIAFFEWLERKTYRGADVITVHSEGNRIFLTDKKNNSMKKIQLIHNWVDVRIFESISSNGKFKQRYGLDSKFILLFAGVIGPAQGLDIILDAASELRDKSDIVFLLVGDGTERARLMKQARTMGLKNVHFQPFVSKDDYPALVKESDVGLVCLSQKNKTSVVPGKLTSYMAGGIPILAILNKESDGHHIITEGKCGISIQAGDKKTFIEAILRLRNDQKLRQEMGEQGNLFVKKHFPKEICINKYEKIFNELRT